MMKKIRNIVICIAGILALFAGCGENPERDFATVKKRLAAYPDQLEEIEKTESYVVEQGYEHSGGEQWEVFYRAVQSGVPAQIDMVHFSPVGNIRINYINYDGTDFYVLCDSSHNAFLEDDEQYQEMNFRYLKVFENISENGNGYREIVLTDAGSLTPDDLLEYSETGEAPENAAIYELAHISLKSEHAAWYETQTPFDESVVLPDAGKIARIEVLNGNIGEKMSFTKGEEFQEILRFYEKLDFQTNEELVFRENYLYLIQLYDENGTMLGELRPDTAAIQVDGITYDGSMNRSCGRLLLKLQLLWDDSQQEAVVFELGELSNANSH